MNNKIVRLRFGNCVHCQQYTKLIRDGLCYSCLESEVSLLGKALCLIHLDPGISIEEIAGSLHIPCDHVYTWIRTGKIRCLAVQFTCPTCRRDIINQVICPYCGYSPISLPLHQENRPPRSALLKAYLEARFSRNRKRQTYRGRLLSSLQGFLRMPNSEL